jgi:hypothetical protein
MDLPEHPSAPEAPTHHTSTAAARDAEVSSLPSLGQLLPLQIRVEANLLRLPLFALHTKGLKTLDGIMCRGRFTRDGQTHEFIFSATRNTSTLYPGPLARAAHLAFLSILTERGLPVQNPVHWSWRDLCRRMRIACSGKTVVALKKAIQSTAGLMIQSQHALYSKPEGQPLSTREDTLHLYDRVVFVGSELPDGSRSDTNGLWLSEWYLQNLNAMFTAPLDYALWRYLDERSPIASRLYEFLLINFYSGTPVLRINYETLVQFLPVHAERYRSDAVRQLATAFEVLTSTKVLSAAHWSDARNTVGQLRLQRGDRLIAAAARSQPTAFTPEEFTDAIQLKELRNLKPNEHALVTDFYRLWAGSDTTRPSKKDLDHAAELITGHGLTRAKSFIPLLVKRLRTEWPDAKSFGAAIRYLPDIIKEVDKQERHAKLKQQEREAQQRERDEAQHAADEKAALRARWLTLSTAEQNDIRQAVLAKQPASLKKYPVIAESLCLAELARRRTLP